MDPRRRAAVVVLGDLGRSPRMQYHALSLANQAGLEVDVVAFKGTEPHRELLVHPHVHLHRQSTPWGTRLPRVLYLLNLPIKVLVQVVSLLWTLCVVIPRPDIILVQNPPAIPTFTVVLLACWLRGARMVIDWHNFGFTTLGMRLGPNHALVRFARWYEWRFGRLAAAHLCVTQAMQAELAASWGIQATVVYDCPPHFFRQASLEERHSLFAKLHGEIVHPPGMTDCLADGALRGASQGHTVPSPTPATGPTPSPERDPLLRDLGYVVVPPTVEETVVSRRVNEGGEETGCVRLKEGRPAVIVSSTSWTPDEDFDVLLEAAVMYDRRVARLVGEAATEEGEGTEGRARGADTGLGSSGSGEDRPRDGIQLEALTHYQQQGKSEEQEAAPEGQSESVGTEARAWDGAESVEEVGDWDRGGAIEGDGSLRKGAGADQGVRGGREVYPRLLILVTGKGPLRSKYEERIRRLRLRRVALRTLWLSAEDYPLLLGSADLGVSLHTSSSGLDLPMKVVDMFGAGLPVCAHAYSCIGELVQDRGNGLLFSTPSELADQLLELFRGFPATAASSHRAASGGEGSDRLQSPLQQIQQGSVAWAQAHQWEREWSLHMQPLLGRLLTPVQEDPRGRKVAAGARAGGVPGALAKVAVE